MQIYDGVDIEPWSGLQSATNDGLGKAMERKFMQSVQTIRGMKIGTIWR